MALEMHVRSRKPFKPPPREQSATHQPDAEAAGRGDDDSHSSGTKDAESTAGASEVSSQSAATGRSTPRRQKRWAGASDRAKPRIKELRQQKEQANGQQRHSFGEDGVPAWQRLHDEHRQKTARKVEREEEHRRACEEEARMLLQEIIPHERLPQDKIDEITRRLYTERLEKMTLKKEKAAKENDRSLAQMLAQKTESTSNVFRGVALYESFMKRMACRAEAQTRSVPETPETPKRAASLGHAGKMHRWAAEKAQRLVRQREEQLAQLEAQLKQDSVHQGGGKTTRHEQLYQDHAQRVKRLEEAQAKDMVKDHDQKVRVGSMPEHCIHLYQDARRRTESLEVRKQQHEEQQAEELRSQSVHAAARSKAWTAKLQEEATQRIARPKRKRLAPAPSTQPEPCTEARGDARSVTPPKVSGHNATPSTPRTPRRAPRPDTAEAIGRELQGAAATPPRTQSSGTRRSVQSVSPCQRQSTPRASSQSSASRAAAKGAVCAWAICWQLDHHRLRGLTWSFNGAAWVREWCIFGSRLNLADNAVDAATVEVLLDAAALSPACPEELELLPNPCGSRVVAKLLHHLAPWRTISLKGTSPEVAEVAQLLSSFGESRQAFRVRPLPRQHTQSAARALGTSGRCPEGGNVPRHATAGSREARHCAFPALGGMRRDSVLGVQRLRPQSSLLPGATRHHARERRAKSARREWSVKAAERMPSAKSLATRARSAAGEDAVRTPSSRAPFRPAPRVADKCQGATEAPASEPSSPRSGARCPHRPVPPLRVCREENFTPLFERHEHVDLQASSVLRELRNVQGLRLLQCGLTDGWLAKLGHSGSSKWSGVRMLDLRCNQLTSASSSALASVVSGGLQALVLDGNRLQSVGFKAICTALTGKKCALRWLSVANNDLTHPSGSAAAEVLGSACPLQELSLAMNPKISSGEICTLLRAAARSQAHLYLDLAQTGAAAQVLPFAAKALARCEGLVIDLSGCPAIAEGSAEGPNLERFLADQRLLL
ncbi:unnamed protein product [Effrenium voratum]|uniref:Uncharacterized protein n=1 Tax=Effrenium voratum TaxID=2562239 RepID=A0AA36IV59_9DINO|nr:unnamed protein product [Effrenium voratum]